MSQHFPFQQQFWGLDLRSKAHAFDSVLCTFADQIEIARRPLVDEKEPTHEQPSEEQTSEAEEISWDLGSAVNSELLFLILRYSMVFLVYFLGFLGLFLRWNCTLFWHCASQAVALVSDVRQRISKFLGA